MPERPRARGFTIDPSEPERGAAAAEAANGAARQPGTDPWRTVHDLTDRLNHRLFGAGLQLHGALASIQDPNAARCVQAALGDLDGAIAELRRAVFDLHTSPGRRPDVSR
ncbi:histidine kinase [Actinomadura sp.]|jgi:hypothetical protein|uniref:histidine kinase n=1 Tax=Actinomadura sp. TaxID=1989 RepID=UPI0033592EB4